MNKLPDDIGDIIKKKHLESLPRRIQQGHLNKQELVALSTALHGQTAAEFQPIRTALAAARRAPNDLRRQTEIILDHIDDLYFHSINMSSVIICVSDLVFLGGRVYRIDASNQVTGLRGSSWEHHLKSMLTRQDARELDLTITILYLNDRYARHQIDFIDHLDSIAERMFGNVTNGLQQHHRGHVGPDSGLVTDHLNTRQWYKKHSLDVYIHTFPYDISLSWFVFLEHEREYREIARLLRVVGTGNSLPRVARAHRTDVIRPQLWG